MIEGTLGTIAESCQRAGRDSIVAVWPGSSESRKAILSREPDETGPYMAITNAIEHHFEAGADRATVGHLIDALAAHATSRGIDPSALGIDASSDQVLDRLRPRKPGTR